MADRAKPTTKANAAAAKAGRKSSASAGAHRVRKHRVKMKALGLKPVTLWLRDVNTPEFKAEVAEAIAAINASEDEKIILKELQGPVEDIEGWT